MITLKNGFHRVRQRKKQDREYRQNATAIKESHAAITGGIPKKPLKMRNTKNRQKAVIKAPVPSVKKMRLGAIDTHI